MNYSIQIIIALFICFLPVIVSETYKFIIENGWLRMPDGVRLSATLTIPNPKHNDEKFPVLLEYKPYRKDDSFYNFNQPNIYYLARRGFIVREHIVYTLNVRIAFVSGS